MKLHHKNTEVIIITVLLFISTTAVEYSKTNEGYAQGFIPQCPNLSKPAEIKPEHLDNLKIEVLSNGSLLEAKWTSYNYHNVKALAKNPDVDFIRKTVVYAPGYFEPTALPLGRNLMVLYKKLGYNVLLLEYVAFTTNIYPVVVRLSRPIGSHVGEMLAKLTAVGLDPKKLELVGLSLGGVIMPFIARRFRQITGRNISSITALDPSGPCVRHLGPDQRLDPSDADFVLHIATNTGGYGTTTPVGHVTVYINGGEYQTGFLTSFLCDDLCRPLAIVINMDVGIGTSRFLYSYAM
ncbi:phospholipase A1 member A-like [Cydia splendana]|uniref:phospholipase A1 member A-like n=1 Tax=Cydia splendana TaxID=1100963 RepID=UPI0028F46F0C